MKTKLLLMMLLTCTISYAGFYDLLETHEDRINYTAGKITSNEDKAKALWSATEKATTDEEAIQLTERASHYESKAETYSRRLNDLLSLNNFQDNQPNEEDELAKALALSLNFDDHLPPLPPIQQAPDDNILTLQIGMEIKNLREKNLLEVCPEFEYLERALEAMKTEPQVYIDEYGQEGYDQLMAGYMAEINSANNKVDNKVTREYMEQHLVQTMSGQQIPNLVEKIINLLDNLGL